MVLSIQRKPSDTPLKYWWSKLVVFADLKGTPLPVEQPEATAD